MAGDINPTFGTREVTEQTMTKQAERWAGNLDNLSKQSLITSAEHGALPLDMTVEQVSRCFALAVAYRDALKVVPKFRYRLVYRKETRFILRYKDDVLTGVSTPICGRGSINRREVQSYTYSTDEVLFHLILCDPAIWDAGTDLLESSSE